MISQARSDAVKQALKRTFGADLRKVILYGSVARNEDSAESDLDVLVVLARRVEIGRDLDAALDALYPFTLEWGIPVHPVPVSEHDFEAARGPFYRRVRLEGVPV